MATKIDLENTYDRLQWEFVKETLTMFDSKWLVGHLGLEPTHMLNDAVYLLC